MFRYNLRLAWRSFGRNPGLTALMIAAIALGIGVCVMTMTVYHTVSGNPIWWKSDRLFAVTMDNWDPEIPLNPRRPDLPPPQLAYRDAEALFASDIPTDKVIMYKSRGVLGGTATDPRPRRLETRITTSGFFTLFETPFRYGSGWNAQDDVAPTPVVVLNSEQNQRLFGGENSVGRSIRWNDREFRIVGVLEEWNPKPKFYDLNNGAFKIPEEVYIPWGWGAALDIESSGSSNCWKPEPLTSIADFRASECVWTQMWVELPTAAARERMQRFIDSYWADQRRHGRFERPQNNRLSTVEQWMQDQQVVARDDRILVGLAFAFLTVCLINTAGLLLAKFLNGAAITGVRRALGASRRQIFYQHLTEVAVIAGLGAALGLAVGALGLKGLRMLYSTGPGPVSGGMALIAHFDFVSVGVALSLAVVAALAAGLYPAWRIGRMAPAAFLKSQ